MKKDRIMLRDINANISDLLLWLNVDDVKHNPSSFSSVYPAQ